MKQLIAVVLVWLGLVTPSAAQTPEWKKALVHGAIGLGMVAHGSDIGVSLYTLGRYTDRYREANPILRPFSDKPALFGATKMALAVGVSYGVIQLHKEHPKWALVAALTQVVVVGYVAHRNSQQIK